MDLARIEMPIYWSGHHSEYEHLGEWKSEKSRGLWLHGYYHICVRQTGAIRCIEIPLTDFIVDVEARFSEHSDKDASYGIVFRATAKDRVYTSLYCFNICWVGTYALFLYDAGKWIEIVGYKQSDFINGKTGKNRVRVEMVGEEIIGSVNRHVLVRAKDRRLPRGDVGLLVSSSKEYYEVSFDNLWLSKVYFVEATTVRMPMPAPPGPPAAPEDDGFTYVIEKLSVPSFAKAPPPEEKPRVTQPAPVAQRPPDLRTYLEGILADAGMTDLTADLREGMIQELARSLNVFMISEILEHMPARYHEAFARLHEENRPQTEINRFIEEHMPNARQVFAEIFEKFRRQYGGKSSR